MAPLKLFTASTPNGHKASVTLELLGLDYDVVEIDISKGAQHESSFAKMNPDKKIPYLVDEEKGVSLGQSGAIVQYLIENYDSEHKLGYAPHTKEHALEKELLFFESTDLTPMICQAMRYKIWAPVSIPEPLERFMTGVKGLFATLEKYLERNQKNGLFFVGDRYCSSDTGIGAWLCVSSALEIDLKEYPLLSAWHTKFLAIPQVKKGLAVPREMRL